MGKGMFKSHLYHQMVELCSCFFYVAMVTYDKLGILRDIPMSQAYSVPFTRTEIDYFSQQVQLLSHVRLPATPWTTAHHASLSITNSWILPRHMSIELVMPSNHIILCCPLLPLTSIFPSNRVFSNESAPLIRWPKYGSFSFNIRPSNEHPGLTSFRVTGWISLQSKGLLRVFFNTTVQKYQFFCAQLSSQSNSHIHT